MRYRILRLRASPSPFPDFWQTSLRPHCVLARSLPGKQLIQLPGLRSLAMAEVEMQVELVQTGRITYFSFHQKPRPNPTLPGRLHFCPVTAKVLGAQCLDTVPPAVLLGYVDSASLGAQRI